MQATLVWDASTSAGIGQVVRGGAKGGKACDMSTAAMMDFYSRTMRTRRAPETKSDLGLFTYLFYS